MIPDACWLALACRSESERPEEWPYVAWVIRNRVERAGFPSTYPGVIRQPWQFSYFNDTEWITSDDEAFREAAKGYARNYGPALPLATEIISAPRWRSPFGPGVVNFWSPVSMKPAGYLPRWNWSILRCFNMPGIDPQRFVFAEDYGREIPGVTGNAEQYGRLREGKTV